MQIYISLNAVVLNAFSSIALNMLIFEDIKILLLCLRAPSLVSVLQLCLKG